MENFSISARELSKNPLGIIALFILLVYGFACLLLGTSAKELEQIERLPIVWFMVIFPIVVLVTFSWLVVKHHNKLYAPTDYRDDESFLKTTITQSSKKVRIEENIDSLLEYGKGFQSIEEQKKSIIADLKERNINEQENKIEILIQHLATEQFLRWFERIYKDIFKSQIKLLEEISNNETYTIDFFENYFNNLKQQYPIFSERKWDMNQYMEYLIKNELIEKSNGDYKISIKGEDFIKMFSTYEYKDDSKPL